MKGIRYCHVILGSMLKTEGVHKKSFLGEGLGNSRCTMDFLGGFGFLCDKLLQFCMSMHGFDLFSFLGHIKWR